MDEYTSQTGHLTFLHKLKPVNTTPLKLPVTKFVILLSYYTDCSEAIELCDQLGA